MNEQLLSQLSVTAALGNFLIIGTYSGHVTLCSDVTYDPGEFWNYQPYYGETHSRADFDDRFLPISGKKS